PCLGGCGSIPYRRAATRRRRARQVGLESPRRVFLSLPGPGSLPTNGNMIIRLKASPTSCQGGPALVHSDVEIVRLGNGRAGLLRAPGVGGSIVRFWGVRAGGEIAWLRPGTDAALARRDPGALAAFPLVPYSNRIRNGRFTFGGETIDLPHPPMREAHAEH